MDFQRPKTTRIFALMLTWQCNLNCVYCFEKHKTKGKEMSLDTAKEIVKKEFQEFEKNKDGIIKVEFFGGEPLLNFELIKELSEWIWQQDFKVDYVLSVTTNGTLLDDTKKAWFKKHKEHFRLIMSVDGNEEMQRHNRGCSTEKLPIDFVRETWPESYFKATASRESLRTFADGVIYLLDKGYNIAATIAVGVEWTLADAKIYKRELEKLAQYYLDHMEKKPMPLFNHLLAEVMEPHCSATPVKACGAGTTMTAYDYDGTPYPCHQFLPVVHGRDIESELKTIDWNDPERMIDDSDCRRCPLIRMCRTCYGNNFNERGDVSHRDRSRCKMLLVETQVMSAFQIHYLVKVSKTRELTDIELYALRAAIKCHNLFKDFSLEDI